MKYHAHIYWKNKQERDIGIDHVKDHIEGAKWIGEPLQLDLEFLKNFQDD